MAAGMGLAPGVHVWVGVGVGVLLIEAATLGDGTAVSVVAVSEPPQAARVSSAESTMIAPAPEATIRGLCVPRIPISDPFPVARRSC